MVSQTTALPQDTSAGPPQVNTSNSLSHSIQPTENCIEERGTQGTRTLLWVDVFLVFASLSSKKHEVSSDMAFEMVCFLLSLFLLLYFKNSFHFVIREKEK